MSRLPIVAVLALCVAGCGGPFLMFPGGALRGEVIAEPVQDWSFADDRFIDLETRPSDPYSVELNYFVREGELFIDPAEGRRWLDYIREDPRVRVRIGGKVFPATAVLAGRPGEGREGGFPPDRYVYRLDFRIE